MVSHRHLSEVLQSLLESALLYGSMAHLHEQIFVPTRFSVCLLEVRAKAIVPDCSEVFLDSNRIGIPLDPMIAFAVPRL